MLKSDDPTYVIAPPFYWSVIESNIGVLAASIPSFKPLAKRFLPRLIGESSQKNSHTYTNNSYHAHYKSSSGTAGGARFNKLGARDGMRMKVFETNGSSHGIEGREYKRSEVSSMTLEEGGGGREATLHSNDSEEQIIKPGQGDIMMTTEFTRTVEERPRGGGGMGGKNYFPGNAV